MASHSFDITAEEMESALRRLDDLMGEWEIKGIRLNYPLHSSPEDASLDEATNIPSHANRGVILNLACELAPSFKVMLSRETKQNAKNAYDNILMHAGASNPIEKQFPSTLPRGAGNKRTSNNRDPFFQRPVPELPDGTSNLLESN